MSTQERIDQMNAEFKRRHDGWENARALALAAVTSSEDYPEVFMLHDEDVCGVVAVAFDGSTRAGGFTVATCWPFPEDDGGAEFKVRSVTISDDMAEAFLCKLQHHYHENTRAKE